MLSVDAALADLVKVCENKWLDWARGLNVGPLRISLRPPAKLVSASDGVRAQSWSGTWQLAAVDLAGEVKTLRRKIPSALGSADLPNRWELSIDDAWRYCPALHAVYLAAMVRFGEAVANEAVIWGSPAEIPDGAAKKIATLSEQEWANALDVVGRLAAGPGQALMVRQLAIPGVHSKWIEKNASLLCTLIGLSKTGPDDGTPLERLLQYVGLQAKEAPIHVALRCPKLRAAAGQLAAFHASIQALNNSTIDPAILLIVENDELGYTLTADIEGMAIIHGLGAAAPLLTDLRWCETARVFYWGDIDRAGLSILATLRRVGIEATSVLMDRDTLVRFDNYAHDTGSQNEDLNVPVELSETERALYQQLNDYYETTGVDLQLEQEALDLAHALSVIATAMDQVS